jgi:two-component system chemotaxis sensor kinase CheA
VLDQVRDNTIPMNAELATLLLRCRDHMGHLVDAAASGEDIDPERAAEGAEWQSKLGKYLGKEANHGEAGAGAAGDGAMTVSPKPAADYWHISLRFGVDVFRNGMDPLSFIRYLSTIGDIVAVSHYACDMPPADEMDPESCYLGFEIGLRAATDKATIENAFEFVRDDCRVSILPPRSKVNDYVALIKESPDEEIRLGDILVRCGALTQNELEAALNIQAKPKPLGEILVAQNVVHQPVVQAALDKQKQVKESKGHESRFIRLDAEKLDILINRIGELVIAGAGISLSAKRAGAVELLEAAATLATLVEDVRDSALQLRMVPIGATFNRFQRVVHDVSAELGKDIALSISGADTEMDKTMVDRIGDPLMHLIRNAMDHGIEPTAARVEQGKSATGTVRLNAYHDAGSIVIEVGDDGGGLKRERILAKAIERGLVTAEQNLSDREVYDIIFEPGFSTAAQISNLSGRGVGMDVVKRSITDLRGTVEVESREGAGTTIRIRLPLTLAIIDGFLVGVGKSVFVVPLDMVEECIELTPAAREETKGRDFVNLRGKVLPFIQARKLFGIEDVRGRRENILVVRYAGQRAGLVVDELMGEAQTVIKPLGKLFRTVKGIGGSTILGDGRVALILDVPGLLQHVHREAIDGELKAA